MLWYQHKPDSGVLALIGYTYGTNEPKYEDDFKTRYVLTRPSTLTGSLTIPKVLQSDSAVYYCAASMHAALLSYNHLTKTSNPPERTHIGFRFMFCYLMRYITCLSCYSSLKNMKVNICAEIRHFIWDENAEQTLLE